MDKQFVYMRETWYGDSRDGRLVGGEGFHYFLMTPEGRILEAFEFYQRDDDSEVVTPLPEMKDVHWIDDMGFEDFSTLDEVDDGEWEAVKDLWKAANRK